MKPFIFFSCFVLLYVLLSTLSSDATLASISAPHYTVTFPSSNPFTRVTTLYPNTSTPTTLLTLFPAQIREVQVPVDIANYGQDADLLTQRLANESKIMYSQTLDPLNTTFICTPISKTNYEGMEFNITLDNGAIFSLSITLNLNSSIELPVPRDDISCNNTNRNRFEANCTCDQYYTIKRYSVKVALAIENWTFAEVENTNTTMANIIVNLELAGPFDLLYYLSLPDVSDLLSFEVCDVGKTVLNMTDNVLIPLSFFSMAYLDGVPSQISTALDVNSVRFNNDGVVFPYQLLFNQFNNTLVYDPDFSVLINGDDGEDGDGGAIGDGGGGQNLAIIAEVVVPVVVVLTIAAIIIGVVIIVLKKKHRLGILHASSSLMNHDESAPI